MKAILLAALLALPAAAQTTGSVFLGIGNYGDLGFKVPLYLVGAAVEHETERFVLALDADMSPTDKSRWYRVLVAPIANEWSATAGLEGLTKLGPVLVGGGLDYSYTRAVDYTKGSLRYHAAAGFQVGRFRALGSHVFKGNDESNDLEGERAAFRADIPRGRGAHRLGFEVGFWRFHASNVPDGPTYHARTWLLTVGEVF